MIKITHDLTQGELSLDVVYVVQRVVIEHASKVYYSRIFFSESMFGEVRISTDANGNEPEAHRLLSLCVTEFIEMHVYSQRAYLFVIQGDNQRKVTGHLALPQQYPSFSSNIDP